MQSLTADLGEETTMKCFSGYIVLGLLVINTAGCMPEMNRSGREGDEADASDEATPRKTVGETTQNVLDLEEAIAEGAVRAETSVTSSNPLTQSAEAYRTTVGKVGGMAVQQAIALRDAQSIQDPQPLSHEEFMEEIIQPDRPDGIQLPMLPYYQEYAWDEEEQELVVVDFPARKEARDQSR